MYFRLNRPNGLAEKQIMRTFVHKNKKPMKKLTFVGIMILAMLSCKEDYQHIVDKAEAMIDEQPDSALALLSECNKTVMPEELQARYSLLYYMAQDKSGMDVDNDSLIGIAYDYYIHHTEDEHYDQCMFYMGNYYMLNDSTKESEDCYNKAIRAADEGSDYRIAYMAREMLARSIVQSNPTEAIRLGEEGVALIEEHDSENLHNHVCLLMVVAESNWYTDDYEQSHEYLNRALPEAKRLGDAQLLGSVYQSIATTFLNENVSDSALHYSRLSMQQSGHNDQQQLIYALSLIQSDSIDKAERTFQDILRQTDSEEMKEVVFRELQKLSYASNDIYGVMTYADSAINSKDVLYHNVLTLRHDYYEEALQQELEALKHANEAEKRSMELHFSLIISTIVIVSFIIFYLLYRRNVKRKAMLAQERHKHQLELQEAQARHEAELKDQAHRMELQMEEERHRQEISTRDLQLSIMRRHLQNKLEVVGRIEDGRDEEKRIVISEAEWKDIEVFLNGVDNLFVERISKAFPQLSIKDIRFCMLLRLGLNTKDLMNVYCINDRSVKQKKYMFKEKLGLTDATVSLKQFIDGF